METPMSPNPKIWGSRPSASPRIDAYAHGCYHEIGLMSCTPNDVRSRLFPAVLWQNQKCRLTLHYENGFTLTNNQPTDDANKLQIYWHYPYEKLRSSGDDGNRILWLDFGDDGEHVRKETRLS